VDLFHIGGDVSFRHAAIVALDPHGDPAHREIVKVPARRKSKGSKVHNEGWLAYIERGRALHRAARLSCIDFALGARTTGAAIPSLTVELFPELIPNNQYQAPAVAAAAWWMEAWPGESSYIEIMDWRSRIFPRSMVAAQADAEARKKLAIKMINALRWGALLDGLNQELKGDVAEAALIALVVHKKAVKNSQVIHREGSCG